MRLSGWGRYPVLEARVDAPRSEADVRRLVLGSGGVIARGAGRAYGDSAINARQTIDMRRLNRLLAFDPASGQLVAEAGTLLSDILSVFLPRGWFPAVSPGTKFVTVGGMIAADVHGKNHHRDGSFGGCVDWIEIMGPDGRVVRCSREAERDLFDWTVGGMGLTGIILRAAFRLRPVETAWIRQTTLPAANLEAAMAIFEQAREATYSVAWIDCLAAGRQLGRSLVLLGEHARTEELSPEQAALPLRAARNPGWRIGMDLPPGLLNRFSVGAFNRIHFWRGARRPGPRIVDWDRFFYPLDAISDWNRLYGRTGLVQFQCVLPLATATAGLTALLEATARAGQGALLSVLKRLGPQDSRFAFPMEGYTLALDFPVNHATLALMDRLDSITLAHGGRFYLAKDSRLTAATLRASDPRVEAFAAMRERAGLRDRFSSAQSDRLAL